MLSGQRLKIKEEKTMKKTLKLLLATLLLLTLTAALFGCGKAELAIDETAMPQTVYVLGEELDLSSGMLVVNGKKKSETVALNDKDVTVTGYDKNQLGEQILTVTYGKASVQYTVTVVSRMQVNDYTADYLVGDTLDLSKGRLKITRNDGSNYTVILKSDKVTVSELDTSTPGARTLTATYKSGDETYTASFTVNVHSIDSVSFTKPTKVTYKSHDTDIDLSGALITLTGKGGELSRDVPVSADMIEGFDLSEANSANTPYTQSVTVNYGTDKFNFDIKITYTSVSMFKDKASLFENFVWSGDDVPDISDEVGNVALEMIDLYLDMSPAEQTLLTKTETLNTARAAMIYGYQKWANDVNDFEGAFELDEYHEFNLTCVDRASIELAIEKLADRTRPIYTLYETISGMIATFGNENYNEVLFTFTNVDDGYGNVGDVDMYFADYTTVDPEFFDLLSGLFAYMLELDTLMDAVGNDWLENIRNYKEEITAVYNSIVDSEYYSYDFAQFFYYVSMWRENDDAFDFLYYYFYEVEQDVSAIIQIANIRLPSALEEVFAHVYEAMELMDALSQYGVSDTTQFFYHYYKACSLANVILDSELPEDEMNKVLFYGLPLNSMLGLDAETIYTFSDMLSYLMLAEGGYYPLCGALLHLPEFEALMDKYLEIIVSVFENEEYEDSAAYVTDVKAMLALYFELTPAQQFCFLGTLNAFYAMNIPPVAFDNTGEYAELICLFVDMVNEVYTGMFTGEDAKNAYLSLVFATEFYAQRYTSDTWLDSFIKNMNTVTAALDTMSDADLAVFNAELRGIYDEYMLLLADHTKDDESTEGDEGTEPEPEEELDLGEWADEFAELQDAVLGAELSYMLIDQGYAMYDLFLTAYERLWTLSNKILTEAPENIRNVFIHEALYSLSSLDRLLDPDTAIDPETEQFWSYDYVLSVYRAVYVNLQLSIGGGIYDLYRGSNMAEFMDKAYDLIWALMWSDEDDTEIFDKNKVLDLMKSFCDMDIESQIIFILYIEGETGMYYDSIDTFLDSYSANVKAAVSKLLEVEMSAIVYNYYLAIAGDDEETAEDIALALEELNAAYAAFNTAYGALTAEELAEFEDFNYIYDFYKTLVEGINAGSNEN